MREAIKGLLITLVLLLTACMPYVRAPMVVYQTCPYPFSITSSARVHLDSVFETDSFYLSLYCARGQHIALLGCTTPSFENEGRYTIYILEATSRAEKRLIYEHEICHVYEVAELGLVMESARHEGWLTRE